MRADIKDPSAWSRLDAGEILAFEEYTSRRITLTFNATAKVSVWVSASEEMDDAVLLSAGEGMFTVRYSADGPTYVQAQTPEGAICFVKGHAPSHRVMSTEEPSFVNIAPRGRPTELARMMHLMRINEKAREAKLESELAKFRAAEKVKNKNKPAPAPEPAPTPAPAAAPAPEPAA